MLRHTDGLRFPFYIPTVILCAMLPGKNLLLMKKFKKFGIFPKKCVKLKDLRN